MWGIHYACMDENSDVAIQLIQRFPQKIDVLGINDWHLLHYACFFGHLKLLKYFLGNDNFAIDFNVVSLAGSTPFHVACSSGQFEVVKCLLENSEKEEIDITRKDNAQRTAEDVARQKGHHEILDLFEIHRQLDVCFWNTIISLVSPMGPSDLPALEF